MLGRRAARPGDRAGRAAVRALAPLRVRARAPLLPRPRQQLRRPRRAHGVGPDGRGAAARRDRVRRRRRAARRRHARVVRRRPARRRHRGARRPRARPPQQPRATRSSPPTVPSPPTPSSRPISSRPWCTTPARRASSRPRARARRACSPNGSGCSSTAAGARARSPRSRTTCAPRTRCSARLADMPDGARRRVRTLHALGNDVLRRAGGNSALIDEWEMRRRIEALVPVKPRANTDMYAPYLDALSEVRLGLVDPNVVEAQRDDVAGFGAMFDEYRDKLHADRAIDHDEQIYGAIEVLLRAPDVRARVPARSPPSARRRVPGPHARATAAAAARRRARVRRVRRRRRRPGDLRLRGRRSRVPHQLRPLLPRRHPSRAGDELPLPGAGRRRHPQPALVQPAPHRQGDRRGQARRRDRRRAHGRHHCARSASRTPRSSGSPRGSRPGAAPHRHRGAEPRELGAPPRAAAARRSRRAVLDAGERRGAEPHRHPHRARVPAPRARGRQRHRLPRRRPRARGPPPEPLAAPRGAATPRTQAAVAPRRSSAARPTR